MASGAISLLARRAGVRLLTLRECEILLERGQNWRWCDVVKWAVEVVAARTTLCMVCAAPIDKEAAYAVLRLSAEPGWEVCAGAICGACGAAHPRGALLEHCRACEALLFSQAAGHA